MFIPILTILCDNLTSALLKLSSMNANSRYAQENHNNTLYSIEGIYSFIYLFEEYQQLLHTYIYSGISVAEHWLSLVNPSD